MKKYRIHLSTMQGKLIYSDPLDVDGLDHEEIVAHLDEIVLTVAVGGCLIMYVNGIEKTYMNHAIESIYWTDGS